MDCYLEEYGAPPACNGLQPNLHNMPYSVVAPPSSVGKCLWGVFVCGFGVLFFVVCVRVGVGGVVICRRVCV